MLETRKEKKIRILRPCTCGNKHFRKVRTETMQSIINYLECTQCKAQRDKVTLTKAGLLSESQEKKGNST